MEQTVKPVPEAKDKVMPAKETPSANSDKSKEISIGAPDIEDEIQLERREAYVEVETQKLLRELLRNETREEIVPSYDPAHGFVYKLVESILDEKTDNKNIPEFLERLTHLDILRKSFYDSVSTCPNCSSTMLTLHTSCPRCKSHNITKTSLTEHIPCGYIGEREKYIDGRCPKCGRSLDDTPFSDMGRWYMCRACGEKFEHPEFDLVCRSCDNIFHIEQASLKEISKYSIKTERKKEVRQNVASLDSISRLLRELNFEIQMPGWAIGEKSGMRHQFSLLARKEINGRQRLIALDMVVGESEVQASPLILYLYKTSEVTVDIPIFVAFPRFSDTAQKIAQGHNMILIEGSPDEPDNVARIKAEIQNRLTPKPTTPTASENTSSTPVTAEKTKTQTIHGEPLEGDKKSQVKLFSTTSTIHPEPKKKSRFMKLIKGQKEEESEE
jgi:hypothetical protein